MPIEPPATNFDFPSPAAADEHGRVIQGGDLEPGTLLAAYRSGLFPMRSGEGDLTWWSPDPRALIHLDQLRVTRSLRTSLGRFETTVDTAFATVIAACADRAPGEYEWITTEIQTAYLHLHELGWAHSVETWAPAADEGQPRELVGGLYGVAIGGVFAGESMFHRAPDASKVALVTLVDLLSDGGRDTAQRFIDVQWLTPHLASLGAVDVARADYLDRLASAQLLAPPAGFSMGRPMVARAAGRQP